MTQAPDHDLEARVDAVRRFNRFYTQRIGVLHEGLLESSFSLTEVRVLFELAHRVTTTASELGVELGLDPGYLSRILQSFQKRRFIGRTRSKADGRQTVLSLTKQGVAAFAALDERARGEVAAMLGRLAAPEQARVVQAMGSIERLLGGRPEPRAGSYLLRPHQPGDMGWIVHRHGVLYAEEYGWDQRFEALVAVITAEFIQRFDPKRERCWMAEKDGEIVGSVLLVKDSKTVAKLRLLLVEPSARGLGIGARLVSECVRFSRQAKYKKLTLWTNSVLRAARRLYEDAGFVLVHEERHRRFGPELVSQTWELDL